MNLFIKYLFYIACCILHILSFAQVNLVPNPSFEDTTSCPNNISQIYLSPPWNTPTLGSPDYFNTCSSTNYCSVPANFAGSENPHTGNAYAGFYNFGITGMCNSIREYIQAPLNNNLINDETYCVEFFVSLAETNSAYAVNNIGAYFSITAVSNATCAVLPYVSQVENTASNPLTNTSGWTKISGQFNAQGGEQFITIGNFNSNALSDTVFIQNAGAFLSYYYIDDVSVIHLDADAGKDTSICLGDSVLLGRPASTGLSYSWQPETGLSSTNIAQPIANPTVSTTYYLTATLAGGYSKQDTVRVTVNDVNLNAGNDKSLCEGSSVTLGTPGLPGITYNWLPLTGLNNPAIAQPLATLSSTTSYTLTATVNGCTATDTISLTVLSAPAVNAGADVIIISGASTLLTGSALAGSTLNWSPSSYLSCDTCASTIALPSSTTIYILTASKNSCSSTDTVTVYVDTDCGELFVPNVFSPNGDNQNDVLKVYGNCISSIDFLIFNRWGEKVFESTELNTAWDGTYKGVELDEAVFVYYLTATVNGVKVVKKGNVSIVR